MKKILALLAAAGVIALIATPAFGAGATVKVGDNFFKAKTVHITKGSTVTWKWAGSNGHNVVGKGFKSKVQSKGTFKHKFTKAGTYHYVCTIHEALGMKGTIVVK